MIKFKSQAAQCHLKLVIESMPLLIMSVMYFTESCHSETSHDIVADQGNTEGKY